MMVQQQQPITMGPNNTITGAYDLTFNGSNVTLYGIGDPSFTNSPLSLTVNANTFSLLGPVYTVNEQTYTSLDGLASDLNTNNADITLNTDLTLQGDISLNTGTGGGDITFGGDIDGAFDLNLVAGTGDIITSGNFGSTTPLTSLAMQANAFTLNDVTTTGDQTYTGLTTMQGDLTSDGGNITFNSAVALAANSTVSSGQTAGGEITFNDIVNGANDLTILGGTADINFNQAVGTTTRLGTLTVNTANDLNFAFGARVTNFIETSGTGTTNFGSDPGLDSLNGVTITAPSYISGRIAGTNVILETSGDMDVVVDVDSLTIGGASSYITGSIGGLDGRDAAQLVRFSYLTGGAHFMNDYNIPLVDSYRAPQSLQSNLLSENVLSSGQSSTPMLSQNINPFTSNYQLIQTDETGFLTTSYLNGDLWTWPENAMPPLFDDVEL